MKKETERRINTEAPRPYFPYPEQLDLLPDDPYLPDLFRFLAPSADPDGVGIVDTAEKWEARREELKDMLKYYLYGSRMDPLKEDTTVTAVRENYRFKWADGVMRGKAGWFGYPEPPLLPEGSCTMEVMDLGAFGMGTVYSRIAPDDGYVHSGGEFPMPGGLAPWKDGDTWKDHSELVSREKLPTVTVEITIRDTNPANAPYRSEKAASEGITHSFDIRFPSEPPVVDGRLRAPKAGYPVLVCMGSVSEAQIAALNNNGYAFIAVNDATDPDRGQLAKYEMLYPPQDPVVYNDYSFLNDYPVDSGNLMHSGWMASRALDAIENYMKLTKAEKDALNPNVTIPDIDVYSSAITGCSNNGKRAIVGGVFDTGDNGDTRFDIIAPSDPGGGGASGFRYATEGQLFSYEPPIQNSPSGPVVHDYAYGCNETTQRAIQNTGEDHWFGDRAQIFTVRPDLADNVPIDAHSLLAAFAASRDERYILIWTGEGQDAWLNSPSTVLNTMAAREAFEFVGQGGNVAVIVRDQAHANQDRDMAELIAVMDHAFYGAEKVVRRFHPELTGPDGRLAADGSGSILPEKVFDSVADMERNPYFIPSAFINWSRPGKHTLWTLSNSVTEGVPMTFTFHTDAKKVELLLTDGRTVLSSDVVNGTARISLSSAQARSGLYMATAKGDRDEKKIEIRGWTVNDALRHSVTDNSALGHDVGSGIAFTTPLTNYDSASDPVRLYLNGVELPADTCDYDNKVYINGQVYPQSGYLQPYGATVMLYPGTEGYKLPTGEKAVFSLRNAKLEALQGFVINMDVELEKYDPNAANPKAAPRMRFRPTYELPAPQTPVWQPEQRQNTPRLGLPKGEDRWPILGNWASDYDGNGSLRPLDEIRPLLTPPAPSAYKGEITLSSSDAGGFTVSFGVPVRTGDIGLAVNRVSGYSFRWSGDRRSLRVDYDSPLPAGEEVTAFVFRSVDDEGHMIGGPVKLRAVV
ncbi:MAG: hypothetical protein J5827_00645 [Oscillospiraceae bacterium]|nr:hypothetical protein [Oscillospiraceae bacterium]